MKIEGLLLHKVKKKTNECWVNESLLNLQNEMKKKTNLTKPETMFAPTD